MSRGRIRAGLDGAPTRVDVLVVGLGVTGVGVALDAAARGLTVLAVDAHDLAFGTSRWSSKLVHGGLRYLANGQVGVAHESAVERGILNVLLFMIVGVAGFGILAIFSMIVVEKTRDIGILKALGASNRGVMGIFLGYGLLLGIVGAGLGTMCSTVRSTTSTRSRPWCSR